MDRKQTDTIRERAHNNMRSSGEIWEETGYLESQRNTEVFDCAATGFGDGKGAVGKGKGECQESAAQTKRIVVFHRKTQRTDVEIAVGKRKSRRRKNGSM